MNEPYDFVRYLAAKKTVDDRALNKEVWAAFVQRLPSTPRILEIGAGTGTMVERLVKRGGLQSGHYTAVDRQPANISAAQRQLQHLPAAFKLQLVTADLYDFARRTPGQQRWEALIAHAFLDLTDIPATLPLLFSMLKPGGLFYFSINFDGVTILEPVLDPAFDTLLIRLYHRTMDERLSDGRPSGDSHSGRHLFHHITAAGGQILAAGSSDWVVFAGRDGYEADEAYFLHFIIHTMHQALQDHPKLDRTRFENWIQTRQAQIEQGELVYIAHQLDFLGETAGPGKIRQTPGPDVSGITPPWPPA